MAQSEMAGTDDFYRRDFPAIVSSQEKSQQIISKTKNS